VSEITKGVPGDRPDGLFDEPDQFPDTFDESAASAEELSEFGVEARSQWKLVVRRFLRHRPAMISMFVLIFMFVLSFVGGSLWKYGHAEKIPGAFSLPPSWEHPFGTDEIGSDAFARVLRGARTSLQVALAIAFLSTAFGTIVGAIAGFYGKWVDALLMRFTDLFLVLPSLVILLVVANRFSGTGSNTTAIMLLIAAFFWMPLARLVRGEILSLKNREFIEAARAIGSSSSRIMFRHLVPNAIGTIIVYATLAIASAILVETALAFLGFGIQPPDVSLGKLVNAGVPASRTRWWLFYLPGAYLIIIVLAVNFVGDGLRDALDPRQNKVRG